MYQATFCVVSSSETKDSLAFTERCFNTKISGGTGNSKNNLARSQHNKKRLRLACYVSKYDFLTNSKQNQN